jgi:hypothetical protein
MEIESKQQILERRKEIEQDIIDLLNTCCIYNPNLDITPEALMIIGEHE